MTEDWKQWEGQVLADTFPLRQYLGGDGDYAVFQTEYSQPASQKAAIKIVRGTLESIQTQLSRWALAAKLVHPNLLRIFSMGSTELVGSPLAYLVMEYADESLAQVVPVRPLSADEAGQMLQPTLSVLEYLHRQGFVHSDLKPGNIKAVGECVKISVAGVCRPGECPPKALDSYSPPEGAASQAGDIWSLGIALVEALTQHLPTRGAGGAHEPLVPETLPQPYLEIARECLHADPQARPTAAAIFAHLRPAKRPMLRWTYALAAATGLVLAALVVAPRLIDRQESVASTPPVQIRQTPPVQPVQPEPKVPAAPTETPVRNEVVQRVLPEVPAEARRTIQGRVKVSVRVRVDGSGGVADAKLDSAGPSKYFAQLALQAARRWKFAAVNSTGPGGPREWVLHFEFSRTGTQAVPVRKRT